jgi:hypothetical protein
MVDLFEISSLTGVLAVMPDLLEMSSKGFSCVTSFLDCTSETLDFEGPSSTAVLAFATVDLRFSDSATDRLGTVVAGPLTGAFGETDLTVV